MVGDTPMALNTGSMGLRPACAPDCSPPRPPLTLQQAVSELNDVAARGRCEIAALENLRDHLHASLRGPVPTENRKDCEAPHLPLAELPGVLLDQVQTRGKLMEEIAIMLGTV